MSLSLFKQGDTIQCNGDNIQGGTFYKEIRYIKKIKTLSIFWAGKGWQAFSHTQRRCSWPFFKLLILLFLFFKMIQCERLGKKAIPVFLSFTVHLPMSLKLQKICYLLSQFVFVSSFHHPFYTKWFQSISEVSIESKYNNIIYIVE